MAVAVADNDHIHQESHVDGHQRVAAPPSPATAPASGDNAGRLSNGHFTHEQVQRLFPLLVTRAERAVIHLCLSVGPPIG
jgi:hypothetical protein